MFLCSENVLVCSDGVWLPPTAASDFYRVFVGIFRFDSSKKDCYCVLVFLCSCVLRMFWWSLVAAYGGEQLLLKYCWNFQV